MHKLCLPLSLSCHPHSVWIYFLVLNITSPPLALFRVFVISCSHLYDRWIIPMATAVIMNPLSELAGENSCQENRDPRGTKGSRETWEHWTDGGRIRSCQSQKGWNDRGPRKGTGFAQYHTELELRPLLFLYHNVQINEWAQTCHVSTEGKQAI